jgi:antitoxin component of MazEF toxin-antitoxin module
LETVALPLGISLRVAPVVLEGMRLVIGAVSLVTALHQPPERGTDCTHLVLTYRSALAVPKRPTSFAGLVRGPGRISVYILGSMKVVKVRRVGNSNVVSLPRELEASGYVPGTSVLVEELPDGELRILPTDRVRERVREIAARSVSERAEALEILAGYDADQVPLK